METKTEQWQWRPRKKQWEARVVINASLSLRLVVDERTSGEWWAVVNDHCVANPDGPPGYPPGQPSIVWADAETAKAAAVRHAAGMAAALVAGVAGLNP